MGSNGTESKLLLVDNEKGYKITEEDFNELLQDNMKHLKVQILLLESKYTE